MTKQLTISCLVFSSFIFSSCSKNETINSILKTDNSLSQKVDDPHAIYSLWEDLTTRNHNNLALSEILAKSVYIENKEYIRKNVAPLSLDEIQKLIKQIESNSMNIKQDLNFYGSNFKNDQELLSKTILETENFTTNGISFEQQFLIKATAKIKMDLLHDILSIYDKRISENSNEIANYIIKDISDNNPALMEKIEKTSNQNPSGLKDLITKTLPTLKKVDTLFRNSELNGDEQLVTASISVIGSQIYNKIKDKKTFKEILKEYREISDVIKKAKEIKALLGGINEYQKEMKNNWQDLSQAMKGIVQDSSELVKTSSSYDPQINGKKIQNFLYETIIKGNEGKTNQNNASLLSQQISLNKNFLTAIDKAEKINNNFATILNSTQLIAEKLNIKLPPGVQKAVETSKKASALFTTVNKTIQGLKNGGVIGALSALSSGPAMELLGLNSDPEAAFKGELLAQLGVIDHKLDDILDLQRQTIKIQIETITMIKDMAIMIDNYHREEMDLLSDIKDITLTNLEMNKIALNSNLKSCEVLLNYQLNSNPNLSMYKTSAYEDMKSFDLDIQRFKSSLNKYEDITQMLGASGNSGWENCKTGLNHSFGLINVSENPIRAIFSSNENQNLYIFQKEEYLPLFRLLKSTKKASPLYHLPVTSFNFLFQKYVYLKNDELLGINYDMENFISTRALERNTAQLLIFYPFLDLDLNEWKSGLNNVISLSIKSLDNGKNTRAYYLLRNNLTLIQAAIAQEALLSGELIFDQLKANSEIIFQNNITPTTELSYAVVTNHLLMKNFIKYMILTNISEDSNNLNLQDYIAAIDLRDIKSASRFFTNEIIQKNLILDKDNNLVLKLVVNGVEQTYSLPSGSDIQDKKILYSENMYRLLELQKRVMGALTKISPNNFTMEQKQQISRMMIFL